jgi:hypothetical protein
MPVLARLAMAGSLEDKTCATADQLPDSPEAFRAISQGRFGYCPPPLELQAA